MSETLFTMNTPKCMVVSGFYCVQKYGNILF